MAGVLHEPSIAMDRRGNVLRRLLPARNGGRPIRVYFDFSAGRGSRRSMTKATVRMLSVRSRGCETNKVVAKAVTAEGEHPDTPGWKLADRLPTRERELVTASFEGSGSERERRVGDAAQGSRRCHWSRACPHRHTDAPQARRNSERSTGDRAALTSRQPRVQRPLSSCLSAR